MFHSHSKKDSEIVALVVGLFNVILYTIYSGRCVAKKLNPGEAAMPYIVELVMKANEDSKVACHSTLFRDISDVFSIPDEMEYEVCYGSCALYSHGNT